MKKQSIAIIISTYNYRRFLSHAIYSAKDFDEIIVVDDNSPEYDYEVAEEIKNESDLNIKIIRNSENVGVAESRNIGIKAAKSTYIALLDADDECTNDRYKLSMQAIRKRADVIYGNCFVINHVLGQSILWTAEEYEEGKLLLYDYLPAGSLCIRKELIRRVGYFDAKAAGADDWDLLIRLEYIKAKFLKINRTLYIRHVHGENQELSESFKGALQWVKQKHLLA